MTVHCVQPPPPETAETLASDMGCIISGVETILAAASACGHPEDDTNVLLARAITTQAREPWENILEPAAGDAARKSNSLLDAACRRLERSAVVLRALLLGGALTWCPTIDASDIIVPIDDTELPVAAWAVAGATTTVHAACQIAAAVLGDPPPLAGVDKGSKFASHDWQARHPCGDHGLPDPLRIGLPKGRGFTPGEGLAYAVGAAALAAHPARARIEEFPQVVGTDELAVSAPLVCAVALSTTGLAAPDPRRVHDPRSNCPPRKHDLNDGSDHEGSDNEDSECSSNPEVDSLLKPPPLQRVDAVRAPPVAPPPTFTQKLTSFPEGAGINVLAPDVVAALHLAVDAQVGNLVFVIAAEDETKSVDSAVCPPAAHPPCCTLPRPDDPPVALPPDAPCYIPAGDVRTDPFCEGSAVLARATLPASRDTHAGRVADACRRIGCAVVELDARHAGLALYPLTWVVQQRRRLGALGPPLVVVVRRAAGALAATRRRWCRQVREGPAPESRGVATNAAVVDLAGEPHAWIGEISAHRTVEVGTGGGATGPTNGGGGVTLRLAPALMGGGVRRVRTVVARLARRRAILETAWCARFCEVPVALVARARADAARIYAHVPPSGAREAVFADSEAAQRAELAAGLGAVADRAGVNPCAAGVNPALATSLDACVEAHALRLALEPRYMLVASAQLAVNASLSALLPTPAPGRILINAIPTYPAHLIAAAAGAADAGRMLAISVVVSAAVAGTPGELASAAELAGRIYMPARRHGLAVGPPEGRTCLDPSGTHLQPVSHCGHHSSTWWPLEPRHLLWTAHPRPTPAVRGCPAPRPFAFAAGASAAAAGALRPPAWQFAAACVRSPVRRPVDMLSCILATSAGSQLKLLDTVRATAACCQGLEGPCAAGPPDAVGAVVVESPWMAPYDVSPLRDGFGAVYRALSGCCALAQADRRYLTPWVDPVVADAVVVVGQRTLVAGMLASLALATASCNCRSVAVYTLPPPVRPADVASVAAYSGAAPVLDYSVYGAAVVAVGEGAAVQPVAAGAVCRVSTADHAVYMQSLGTLQVLAGGGHGALNAGPPDSFRLAEWLITEIEVLLA